MHLDGFHAGLFEQLLEDGMLPHFAFLRERGRLSTRAVTVDKSETFKAIQAYLTSQLDTRVVGWWQFDRDEFHFRNFWLDPVQVANYALGLEFPRYPTVIDVVAARGGNVASGFSLYRRGVPFANYSRNYLEGARAAFDHTYFAQAHATMSSFLVILERIARSESEALPVFSTSLLGVADEFAHLDGIVHPRGSEDGGTGTACFERAPNGSDDPTAALFADAEGAERIAADAPAPPTGPSEVLALLDEDEVVRAGGPAAPSQTRATPRGTMTPVVRPAPSEKLVDQLELGLLESERRTQTPSQVFERAPRPPAAVISHRDLSPRELASPGNDSASRSSSS
jgi:hypothetical protein